MIDEVFKDGVRYKDEVTILPFQGKKRRLKLMRTQYHISSTRSHKVEINDCEIIFPDQLDFEVSLDVFEVQGELRYFFHSLNDHFYFKLNGNFVRSALVLRGDKVQIGYNFFYFENEKVTLDELIPSEVITSNLGVLLIGESGSGKTKLANEIHESSGVRGKFVHLNLSSYSENLIESEIFGHIKGAFTGADSSYEGALSEASHGTLFFDEIDSLPLHLQVKLLLFLDSKKYKQVGSVKEKQLNTRIIFSSGQALEKLIGQERMRKDFYFRLNSFFKVILPSLRDKRELIDSFLYKFMEENRVKLSIPLKDFYRNLNWPGNYRQLKEHLSQKLLLSNKKVLDFCLVDQSLTQSLKGFEDSLNLEESCQSLDENSLSYFLKIFYHCKGNKAWIKNMLSISEYKYTRLLKSVDNINNLNVFNS